ncbi:MAG: SLC13 family permease, partial [Pseudomonadota bacterium]|nr:SLC13 family permease [Pseudomonadota bacterium]
MVVSGCLTASRARRSVDLPVLVVIASSFALGNAMTVTGAAQWVASGPGRYQFMDYVRIGLPLSVLVACVAVGLIPLVWGFG